MISACFCSLNGADEGINKTLSCASLPPKLLVNTAALTSKTVAMRIPGLFYRPGFFFLFFAYKQDSEIVDLIALSVARKEHAIICNLLNLQMPVQNMQLRIVPFRWKDGVIKCGVCLCLSVSLCVGRNGFVKLHVAWLQSPVDILVHPLVFCKT